MPEPRPVRNLLKRIKEHRVVTILGVVFGPLGVWLKRLIDATDWVSRFDTWSLHRPAVPLWSGDFLRLLTPDLPLIGYVLSLGFLTLLFFARERRATTPISAANLDKSEVAELPAPFALAHKEWLAVPGLRDPRETFRKQRLEQLEDRRLEALAEAAEEELKLKRLELARINDANLELDLELARKALEKRREEEALGVLLGPVVDALKPKPAFSLSRADVDSILGFQASSVPSPDVTLEFSSPGPFTLRNFGATACEVQIECDSLNESLIYEVAFPIVADLHNAPITVTPEIEPTALWGKDKDIMSVLHTIARHRAIRMQGENSNSIETSRIVSEMEPIHFQLGVTYIDRRKSRKWRKNEVLVYDPRKETAYIKHGESSIIELVSPSFPTTPADTKL